MATCTCQTCRGVAVPDDDEPTDDERAQALADIEDKAERDAGWEDDR